MPDFVTARTAFRVYFVDGSAVELSVTPGQGYIEPELDDSNEFPFEVIFKPKIAGRVMKGRLVVDTAEAQYIFDIVGRMPQYVPPVVTKVTVEDRGEVQPTKKRNIIRDNIEDARSGRSSRASALDRRRKE
jgi:hypothetical protein